MSQNLISVRALSAWSFAAFLLAGCTQPIPAYIAPQLRGPSSPGEQSFHREGRSESYNVAAAQAKIDILFMVDNSGSMENEQNILATSFGQFINQFITRNLDFHVGVVTTDVTPLSGNSNYWSGTNANSAFYGYQSPGPGRLLSRTAERYLQNTSQNLVSQFQANVNVGTRGSGNEQGLESIYETLDPLLSVPTAPNAGFVRNDALLSLVIVSDEDECLNAAAHSMPPVETAQQRIDRTLARIQAAKGNVANMHRLDYIINLDTPPTNQTYPAGLLYYPQIYLMAAAQTMATPINIGANFSAPLVALGDELAVQAERQFQLSAIPIVDTIDVLIDGAIEIPHSADNGWSYLPAPANRVQLNGNALLQARGHVLTISYETLVAD
ncbi:MAG: vWA domain-containing protein [Bacteriovoracia bacterium]